ncbi:MAG: hypothetical protein GY816_16570 [Cytophagales bacterium]|nr:hypothetical protein [Cytophagales bacterium]
MKTLKLTIACTLLVTASLAQSKKYIETMEASIAELYAAETVESFDPVINKFTRIGQAEKMQWEPYYYASLANVFKAFRIQDLQVKDAVLDQALASLKQASELSENNVEIVLFEGFINMIKIGVDPATRGQTLSPGIMASFGKAMKMDPDNPRATLFMGQMQFGTAQFFGSDLEVPCGLINRSIELFDSSSPESSIAPAWGKSMVGNYVESCSGEETESKK